MGVYICALNVNAVNSVLNPSLSDVKQEAFKWRNKAAVLSSSSG